MADDIKKIQDELEDLERQMSSIASQLGTTFINSFTSARNKAEDLTKEFNKGKDISKQLDREMRKLKNSIDSSYSIEAKLNEELAKQLTSNRRNAAAKADSIRNQISILQNERNLNIELEYQYRELEKINDEERKQSTLSSVIKDKIKGINREYFTTLGLLKLIVNATLASDEQTTALAKSFGVTKRAAKEVRDNMVAFSRAADSSFVNVDRLFKAQQALTEQLGIAVDFGGKEQEQFARLTEIVGLSADEAGKLAKFSAATGVSTDKYVADIRKSVFFAERTNKIHVSDKEILSTISKLSAGILVKFSQNPKAIAEAVVQAKALGTSLEQVDKTGESLLNWETSIGNELEAELITGKQINLEKARYAALTGDQVTLMNELANQVGSLADYQNMNVIAQQSLAQAFGMSREEMSEMLIKQQAITQYGDKAAQLNAQQLEDLQKSGLTLDEYLEKQDKQRSIQEKFNDAILKLQDLIGNLVAGPLGRMLDIIVSITEHTKLLAALASIYIARLIVINTLKAREAILAKKSATNSIVDAVAAAVKSASSVPVIGWVIGAGLAAGLFASLTGMFDKGDDVISPGYGKRMLLDKGSVTAFNDNDTIVAGTNLGGGNRGGGGGGGNSMDVVSAIRDMHNELKNSNAKPAVAYINGKDAFADNLGRSRNLGTSQNINTGYKVA